MPQISRSALVPYSAHQLYQLVNDVETYPEFLPGCSGSKILSTTDNTMIASVDVSKMGIRKTFTTRNTLIESKSITMQLIDGPFRALSGGWFFTSLGDSACKVELNLSFEFTNKLVEIAFGQIFNELVSNMIQAFTLRAKEVYRD